MKTTWRVEITNEMNEHQDSFDEMEAWAADTPSLPECLDKPFNHTTYPVAEGPPFTIWTKSRVYFPASHDGQEWCASVARHPDAAPTRHIGAQE